MNRKRMKMLVGEKRKMDSPTNYGGERTPSSPTVSTSNQSHADLIISSILSFPDSSPISFDQVLEKALASASPHVSVQDCLADRIQQITSRLLKSTERYFQKRDAFHNSNPWPLPRELTIKASLSEVFSMLDTRTLMQAATCCTMFRDCAMDPLCYAHIGLKTECDRDKDVGDRVLFNMVHRAGKEIRSLKLGRVTRGCSPGVEIEACLLRLSDYDDFHGSCLRSLHFYNMGVGSTSCINEVLSVCPNITDLRIVGIEADFMDILETLTEKCHFIDHLCFESNQISGTIDTTTCPSLIKFVTYSPNLTSLTLINFPLTDEMARILAESSRTLKYLNLSRSSTIKGRFLRDLGHSCKDSPLKTLILRNCFYLEEKEVLQLCDSLVTGGFKSIQHIDVSNKRGLLSVGGEKRSYKPNFPLEKLKEERPDVTFVADFPLTRPEECYRVYGGVDEEALRVIEKMECDWDPVRAARRMVTRRCRNSGTCECGVCDPSLSGFL